MIRKRNAISNKGNGISSILKVGEEIVSIQTSKIWTGIQIEFRGRVEINSLLPEDYIVESGINKIIIIKFNKRDESLSELFKYKGKLNVTLCTVVLDDLNTGNSYIDRSSLQLWNVLHGSANKEGRMILKDWAYLGENWEDLDFDGNNDRNYYTYRKRVYDKESKTYTQIKELRKK